MDTMERPEDIEIRSDDVQEILGDTPSWLIRWGVTSVFTMVILILAGTWFIEYPDTIPTDVVLTTEAPPARIISRSSGRVQLMVTDRARVKEGQVLGIVKNTAHTADMLAMINYLNSPDQGSKAFFEQLPDSLQLGEVLNGYQSLLMAIKEQQQYEALDRYRLQLAYLKKRLQKHQKLDTQLNHQQGIQRKEVQLAWNNFKRDSTLWSEGIESLLRYEASNAAYLQSERSFEQGAISITNNLMQIDELQSQLANLKLDEIENRRLLMATVGERLEQFKSQVENWKQQYLLVSPVEGNVTFTQYWQNGQFVNVNDEVMTVVPGKGTFEARARLRPAGSGKVKAGNKVIIRFHDYPEQEYGKVHGVVEYLSLVPRENNYIVNIRLSNGLMTSYQKELPFRQEMTGTAEIVTDDLKLIDKLFNNIRKLMSL